MGFALLLVMKNQSNATLVVGGVIALLLILTAGMLRKNYGWILGSILQIAMIAYGFIVTPLFFLGRFSQGYGLQRLWWGARVRLPAQRW